SPAPRQRQGDSLPDVSAGRARRRALRQPRSGILRLHADGARGFLSEESGLHRSEAAGPRRAIRPEEGALRQIDRTAPLRFPAVCRHRAGARMCVRTFPCQEEPMTYPDTRLLIDGQWRDALDGRTLAVLNPATGEQISRVAHASIADLDLALAAAERGFQAWRRTPAIERAKIMRRAAALMRERADGIARLLTQEQGKPLPEAKMETLAAADIIEWFADEGLRVYGR